MKEQQEHIKRSIKPLRQQIIQHRVYAALNTLDDLKIFMKYHVYAVWDFMSLLKALQNNLTCTSVPWFPKGDPDTRHLINEIVVGEESDVDAVGNRKSHFEIYLDAMEQCGADTSEIKRFTEVLKNTGDFDAAFIAAGTPPEAQDFVEFTFKNINDNKDYIQAAIFTLGREDLIPTMFHSIIRDLYRQAPDSISIFNYYLERHIEMDGDHHSHLALQMTSNLCSENEQRWKEAEEETILSLKKRITLWDGVYREIIAKKRN
jgi:hypothetical protein